MGKNSSQERSLSFPDRSLSYCNNLYSCHVTCRKPFQEHASDICIYTYIHTLSISIASCSWQHKHQTKEDPGRTCGGCRMAPYLVLPFPKYKAQLRPLSPHTGAQEVSTSCDTRATLRASNRLTTHAYP